MKFSQSSFVYFNYSIQDAIRHLAHCGYKGIEFWGGRPHLVAMIGLSLNPLIAVPTTSSEWPSP